MPLIPVWGGRSGSEFRANLVYKSSSRAAKATPKNSVLKTNPTQPKLSISLRYLDYFHLYLKLSRRERHCVHLQGPMVPRVWSGV